MLKNILKEQNINISDEQINLLNKLREICLEYNKHTNLTNITDEEEFNRKHILDSLSINKYLNENTSLLDVGSGGGFPGLAIAITNPSINVVMIDSNNKKITFINEAINILGIKNASTINKRVEEAKIRGKYNYVVSRAVAPLNILLEITSFAAKIGGEIICYKGINLKNELPSEWEKINSFLGISFKEIVDYKIDDKTTRKLLFLNKDKATKANFPRLYTQIKQEPIYN